MMKRRLTSYSLSYWPVCDFAGAMFYWMFPNFVEVFILD